MCFARIVIQVDLESLKSSGNGVMHKLMQTPHNSTRSKPVLTSCSNVMSSRHCYHCRYDNWVAAMVDWKKAESSQEWHKWVQQAFEAFDVDGSGSIGVQDLQNMLCGELCAVSPTTEGNCCEVYESWL